VEFTFLLDRRPDATIALISPQRWSTGASGGGALMRLPQPPPRLSSSQFAPPVIPDEEQGASFAEVVHRVVAFYQFLRNHLRLIVLMLAAGVGLGLLSVVIVPPPRSAFCEVKLQPQMKSNPVEQVRPQEDW